MFNWLKHRKWTIFNAFLVAVLLLTLGVRLADQDGGIGTMLATSEKVITIGNIAYAAGSVDYTLDGTDDNVQFQLALNALPATGGKIVVVSAVQVNFSATVTRAIANVSIVGSGVGTYFANDGVTALFTAGGNNWSFYDFRTDAGGINLGATTGWVFYNCQLGATYYAVRTASSSSLGNIVPETADTYDVGSTTNEWNDVYVGSGKVYLGTDQGRYIDATHPATRTATLTVAASDASAWEKAQADYVCDGSSDDVQINAAATAIRDLGTSTLTSGMTLHISGGTYDIDAALDLTEISIQCDGLLLVSAAFHGDAITIGSSPYGCQAYFYRVQRAATSGAAGDNGVVIKNTACSQIWLPWVYNFHTNVKAFGSGGATGYLWKNEIHLGSLQEYIYGLHWTGDHADSWLNDNQIFGGIFSSAQGGAKGIYFSGTAGCEMSSNTFRSPDFESGVTGLEMTMGDGNHFQQVRSEVAAVTNHFTFSGVAGENYINDVELIIDQSSSILIADTSTYANNLVHAASTPYKRLIFRTDFQDAFTDYLGYNHIPGMSFWFADDAAPTESDSPHAGTKLLQDSNGTKYLRMATWHTWGTIVDTTTVKRFWVKGLGYGAGQPKILIHNLDANGALIDASGNVKGGDLATNVYAYSAAWKGGGFDPSDTEWMITFSATVKYAFIAVMGNADANFTRGLEIYAYMPYRIAQIQPDVFPLYGGVIDNHSKNHYSQTITYHHTDALFNAAGTTDSTTWVQPGGTVLTAVQLRLTEQFVAAGLTDLDIEIGDGGDANGILAQAMDLQSDAVNTLCQTKGALWVNGEYYAAADTTWTLASAATGADLNTLTAGEIKVVYSYRYV